MKEENLGKPVRRPLLFGGDAHLARGAAPDASPTATGSAVPGGQSRAEPCPGSGRRSWADPPRLFHPSLARGRRQEPVNTRSPNARKNPPSAAGRRVNPALGIPGGRYLTAVRPPPLVLPGGTKRPRSDPAGPHLG